jgi:hypothetical protein
VGIEWIVRESKEERVEKEGCWERYGRQARDRRERREREQMKRGDKKVM